MYTVYHGSSTYSIAFSSYVRYIVDIIRPNYIEATLSVPNGSLIFFISLDAHDGILQS